MLAAASVTEALYVAAEADPSNIYVVAAVESGLPDTLALSKRTPGDVQSWVKSTHNAFHVGASTSFLELIDQTAAVESAWACYRIEKAITVDSCPKRGPHRYEALYMKYISEKHKDYSGWEHYKHCKQFRNKMLACGGYKEWKAFVEERSEGWVGGFAGVGPGLVGSECAGEMWLAGGVGWMGGEAARAGLGVGVK